MKIFIGVLIAFPLIIGIISMIVHTIHHLLSKKNHAFAIPSLLFHTVTDKRSINQSHIKTAVFNNFLDRLNRRNYTTLTAYEAATLSEKTLTTLSPFVVVTFDDGFESVFTHAIPVLDRYAMKATVFPIVKYFDTGTFSSWDVYPTQKHLSKQQIRAIAESGHEIGSHTLTHPDLRLLSEKELEKELSESKKILEDILGRSVVTVSFPWGSWNERVWRKAQECGYKAAVAYRKHRAAKRPILPATGVYRFDTVEDIIEKIENKYPFSNAWARGTIMPHFAKGAAMWKFRSSYSVFNYFLK